MSRAVTDRQSQFSIKASTYTLFVARSGLESSVESADSITEFADATTDSVMIGWLSILNLFNILNPPESADGKSAKWVRALKTL